MKIGTDVSLETCKVEGYMIMEYKKRELFTKGVLNPDASISFKVYYPEYDPCAGQLHTDTQCSANDVWERYNDEKEGIDSYADGPFEFPSDEYSLLHLADSVNSYCGLY